MAIVSAAVGKIAAKDSKIFPISVGIADPSSAGGGFADWLFVFAIRVVTLLIAPPILVAIVLLYYNMRARKEAFDSTALAQELMH